MPNDQNSLRYKMLKARLDDELESIKRELKKTKIREKMIQMKMEEDSAEKEDDQIKLMKEELERITKREVSLNLQFQALSEKLLKQVNDTNKKESSVRISRHDVAVTSSDREPGFLEQKLIAGDNISITKNDSGRGQTLTITGNTVPAAIGSTINSATAGSILFVNPDNTFAQDNSNLYWNPTTHQLSIGTNAPYKDATVFINNVFDGTNDSYGQFVGKTYDIPTGSSAQIGALTFVVNSTGSGYLSGQLKGVEGFVFHGGTNTANQLLGGSFIVQKNGIGPINAAYGLSVAIQNNDAAGTIGNSIGLQLASPTTIGPIGNSFGAFIFNQASTNVTNAAGIYLSKQAGAVGLNADIYSESANWIINALNNTASFIIQGVSDNKLFYIPTQTNAIGIGTSTPKNKLDVFGSMAIGSAYAGTNVAPSQGLIVEGNVAIGTTDFSALPGASATVFSIVSKVDSTNNTAHGGMYFRTIMNGDNQETFGSYNLVSTSGMVVTSGTHILGAQNEIYLQNTGNAAAFDNAQGILNFMEANGDYSHAIGINNIIYGSGFNTQTIGNVTIMPVSDSSGTHAGTYSLLMSSNSTAGGSFIGDAAALTWSSPSATIAGVAVSAVGIGIINNPSQQQVGVLVNWNIAGTDTANNKFGIYVQNTPSASGKSFFGDPVGIGVVPTSEALTLNGNVRLDTIGNKVIIKEGSNASLGVATMTAGVVTVSNTVVTNSSRIFLTPQNTSGTAGSVFVSARVANSTFTIASTSTSDTRQVAWQIIEPV